MRHASLNMGVFNLAITSLSILASHSTHRQTKSKVFLCKCPDLSKFGISWKKCLIWTNYFIIFPFMCDGIVKMKILAQR